MRRIAHDESGAVAVIVAILAVVLFGMAALVIDVGQLYEERRELQNGADAAALAIVAECRETGAFPTDEQAQTIAEYYGPANSLDSTAFIENVAFAVDGSRRYVQVTARTGDLSGPGLMPPLFSAVLGFLGTPVSATATAFCGPAIVAPIAFGTCELIWLLGGEIDQDTGVITKDGESTDLASLIEEAEYPISDALIGFQGGKPVNEGCQENSGQDKEGTAATGNFGWLATGGCFLELPEGDLDALWIEGTEGAGSPECTWPDLEEKVDLLVIDEVADVNTNAKNPSEPLDSPLCPIDGNGNISCYKAAFVMRIDTTGARFSGGAWPGCDLLKNGQCIQGTIEEVLTLDAARVDLRVGRLVANSDFPG